MSNFKPTWLYIKQHELTKLKYFGKTTAKDPIKYSGSGKYWKDHLEKHGYKVITLWFELFTNKQTLIDYATTFSKDNNIIDCAEWANLIEENGLDGWIVGHKRLFKKRKPLTEEHKIKLRTARAKQIITVETKKKISDAKKGSSYARHIRKPHSEETKRKISEGNKGKVRTEEAKLKYSIAKSNISEKTRKKQSVAHLGKIRGSYKLKDVNFIKKA